MSRLVWGSPGEKVFESGIDRGVLYAVMSRGRAWNGLISVNERITGAEPRPIYQDGVKVSNRVIPGEFEATLEAYTYPEQFFEYNNGFGAIGTGLFADEQTPRPFGLSYRTMIGNPVDGKNAHYKIHLIYNAVATPSDRMYQTHDDNPETMTFSWDITTTPVRMPKMRPSSHLIVDSRYTSRRVLNSLEDLLYGTSSRNASWPSPQTLVEYFYGYNFSENGYGHGPYGLTTYGHGQES